MNEFPFASFLLARATTAATRARFTLCDFDADGLFPDSRTRCAAKHHHLAIDIFER